MRPVATMVAALTLCLLAAGCSGGQEGGADADPVRTTTVTMPKSYRFEPASIQVDAGATVTWKNEDNFTHDVTIEDGDESGEHTVEPGEQVRVTFDEPGTYEYVCRFHSNDMRGTVIVS